MQMDLYLDLEIKHKELFKIFSRFSLDPVIQADTAITQCCNFSRDSLALENG